MRLHWRKERMNENRIVKMSYKIVIWDCEKGDWEWLISARRGEGRKRWIDCAREILRYESLIKRSRWLCLTGIHCWGGGEGTVVEHFAWGWTPALTRCHGTALVMTYIEHRAWRWAEVLKSIKRHLFTFFILFFPFLSLHFYLLIMSQVEIQKYGEDIDK